jgi:apolipoprotein D and lipocalin family protein
MASMKSSLRGILFARCVVGGLALAFTFAFAAPAAADTSSNPVPLKPVSSLDIARYLGDWYQLAAIPQPFSLICARDTMANYQLIDPSDIRVENTCTTWTSNENKIVGNARVNDKATGAQLHVSFPGVPTQESKDGPTNYVVTYIADDYSWAFVGSPQRTSAFVLSRSPNVSTDQWQQIRTIAEDRGYNACLILTSPTTGGSDEIRPLCTV